MYINMYIDISIFLKSFLQCFQTIFYDFFILVRDALSVQVILHSVNWASGTKGLSFSKTATRATQLHVCPAPDIWKQLFGLG